MESIRTSFTENDARVLLMMIAMVGLDLSRTERAEPNAESASNAQVQSVSTFDSSELNEIIFLHIYRLLCRHRESSQTRPNDRCLAEPADLEKRQYNNNVIIFLSTK